MAINSKAKGSAGERELAHFLRDHGWHDARRTAQYCGKTGDAADIVGLPGIHVECKRVEHLNIDDALAQAKRDSAGSDRLPAVFHRKNNTRWKVTMDIEDWLQIYQEYGIDMLDWEDTDSDKPK